MARAHKSSGAGQPLSGWQLLSYGLPTAPLSIGGFALVIYLPTFYAIDKGLGLALVGLVFSVGRIVDIVTDPLIGHWSDETRSKFGPRLPWIAGGTVAYCLALWLLLSPPAMIGIAYLIFACGLYFLAYTAIDIPYSSIGLEISPHVHERSLLAGSRMLFHVGGGLIAAALPFLLAWPMAENLSLLAQIAIALCVAGLLLLLFEVPRRIRTVTNARIGLKEAIGRTFNDRRFRFLAGAFFLVQMANSFVAALTLLFASRIMGDEKIVGLLFIIQLLSAAVSVPLWIWLSRRYAKKHSWLISIITGAAAVALFPLVGEGDVMLAACLLLILGCSFGCDTIMPTSILADIVYDRELEGESRLAGMYQSVKNAVSKLAFVGPMAVAFPVLGAIGFNESGGIGSTAKWTFLLFYSAVPILFRLAAIALLSVAPDMRPLRAELAMPK